MIGNNNRIRFFKEMYYAEALSNLTVEQQEIVKSVETHNVAVDAVAGSGKTTTILNICDYYTEYKFLILTYNSHLKLETRKKIEENPRIKDRAECHSFHAMCDTYYSGWQDINIAETVTDDLAPKMPFKYTYDVIIIDETQDMKPLFFELCCKIFKDNNNPNARIVILGDVKQSIYQFNEADERFIQLADQVFRFNPFPWRRLTLSRTFRLTQPMVKFVNKVMLKNERMYSEKAGTDVEYYYYNQFEPYEMVNNVIKTMRDENLKNGDVFILMPSVKSANNKSPLAIIVNSLKNKFDRAHIFVNDSKEQEIDERVLRDKVIVTTFHSCKGMERKAVFLIGFDNSYFQYYSRNCDTRICPNTLYVAATRASQFLKVFHGVCFNPDYSQGYLDFIRDNAGRTERLLNEHARVLNISKKEVKKRAPAFSGDERYRRVFSKKKTQNLSVTELVKYLPFSDERELMAQIEVTMVGGGPAIELENVVQYDHKHYEAVQDLNGNALPAYVFTKRFGKKFLPAFNMRPSVINDDSTIEDFLKESLEAQILSDGFQYRKKQLREFKWLNGMPVDRIVANFNNIVANDGGRINPEVVVKRKFPKHNVEVRGRIDFVDYQKQILWEIKCVKRVTNNNLLQLAAYAALWSYQHPKDKYEYKLLNMLDGTVYTILPRHINGFKAVLARLVEIRQNIENNRFTDEQFLANCQHSRQRFGI